MDSHQLKIILVNQIAIALIRFLQDFEPNTAVLSSVSYTFQRDMVLGKGG